MTETVWRDRTPVATSPDVVRLLDHSLEQVLGLIASEVASVLPADREVHLVLRGRHANLTWGAAAQLRVLPAEPHDFGHRELLRDALDAGAESRRDRIVVQPVQAGRRVIGALMIMAASGRTIGSSEIAAATDAITPHVGMLENAMAYAEALERAANLERAMEGRAVIEQAKGVLIARHHCTPDEAFAMLRDRSQRTDVKVAVVAGQVLAEVRAAETA